MATNEDEIEFDENEAVKHINKHLSDMGKEQYGDDDILLLIDAMYDFYESTDSFESDDDADDNLEDLVKYVQKAIAKDPENKIVKEDVKEIVIAELDYESTLE